MEKKVIEVKVKKPAKSGGIQPKPRKKPKK